MGPGKLTVSTTFWPLVLLAGKFTPSGYQVELDVHMCINWLIFDTCFETKLYLFHYREVLLLELKLFENKLAKLKYNQITANLFI